MNDHDFIVSMRDQCNTQLGSVTPPNPTPIPGVVMLDANSNPKAPTPGGSASLADYAQDVTYAFLWTGGNILAVDATAGSGSGLLVELGAAPTAGDWPYAKSHSFPVTPPGGGFPSTYHPYTAPAANPQLTRPLAGTVPPPFYAFLRCTNMNGKMIVQLSLP